jgi:hypothetical protein
VETTMKHTRFSISPTARLLLLPRGWKQQLHLKGHELWFKTRRSTIFDSYFRCFLLHLPFTLPRLHHISRPPILIFSILLSSFPVILLFRKEKHRNSTDLDYGVVLDLSGERTAFTVLEQTAGKHRNAKRVTKLSDNVVKSALTELY